MKKVLIVVDMQKDFVDGALGTKEAVSIVPNVVERINKAKAEGEVIIATRDTHFENYLDTLEGKKLPVKHCIKETDGWLIYKDVDEVLPKDAIVIDKLTFGFTAWDETFKKHFDIPPAKDIEEIELVGLCTDICVISNALILRALYPDKIIKVNSSCCAGVTVETHNAALETMKMCQIDVI